MNYIFLLLCAFWLPSMMIALGLVYVFKKDWAWRITQRILRSVEPQRTSAWNLSTTFTGVILIVIGVAMILFLFLQLSN